jgi:hypothetical protein
MAKKQQMVEVVIKTADGKNQATAMVAFECEDGTCEGSIVSIAAKTPHAEFGWAWKIGLGTSAEISMSPGSVVHDCVEGNCVYTITASWTVRAKLTIGIQWYDKSKTFIGTGTFTSNCNCEE